MQVLRLDFFQFELLEVMRNPVFRCRRNHYEQAKLHDETDQNVLIKTFDWAGWN